MCAAGDAPPLAEYLGQVARGDAATHDGVDGVRARLDVDVVLALRGGGGACGAEARAVSRADEETFALGSNRNGKKTFGRPCDS